MNVHTHLLYFINLSNFVKCITTALQLIYIIFKIVFQRMSAVSRRPGTIKLSSAYYQNNEESFASQLQQSKQLAIDKKNCNIQSFPLSIEHHSIENIAQLILDNNSIQQCTIDPNIYYNLKILSMQHNNLHKFAIKRSLTKYQLSLTHLNVSNNSLQFMQLSSATKLAKLILHHNCLSTIILPQQFVQYLDISYNMFSNIQYSVLSGRVFPKLNYLNVSYNNKSLYDLVLAINKVQLAPALIQLDCSYNILSYFQYLPTNLKYLNLEENQFIFDRKAVNQIIILTNLQSLKLSGNVICENFLQLIKSKLQKGKHSHTIVDFKNGTNIRESPYKLYDYPTNAQQKKQAILQQSIVDNCFTLRNYDDDNQIDPDYNLLSAEFVKPQHKSSYAKVQQYVDEQKQTALAVTQNKLKPQKFKLNINGDRFHNHYKFYFQQLSQFMEIPPHPIRHADRTKNVSSRIDPCDNSQILNEFSLINEMFRKRGGVQYVRKVYNWSRTQQLKNVPNSITFINIQLNKEQFETICNGNYQQINKSCNQKHTLSPQPQSFSIYHILAKLGQYQNYEQLWSCFYFIEASQL